MKVVADLREIMNSENTLILAADHGLELTGSVVFNEMGLDFRVGFASDKNGQKWVLRIPRRDDMATQIKHENKILGLAKKYLTAAVPDWHIATPHLVAYPLLPGKPVLTYDATTYEVTWNIDQESNQFVTSLAKLLVELHSVPTGAAEQQGLSFVTSDDARKELIDNIDAVKKELVINADLEARWRNWAANDSLWPTFSTFIHGDLYAGHILAERDGNIRGVIDWSEAKVSDPSTDFSGHIAAFGKDSLRELIEKYKEFGGRVWNTMFEQTVERHAASPLNYAVFALKTNSEEHVEAAKAQLGV